jgi:hypothetical protein
MGSIQPFDNETEALKVCADLRQDHAVKVQAGHLRHKVDCAAQHAPDPTDPWMVNLGVAFRVLVLQFQSGRHPRAYALSPEVSRQRFPLHPHLRDDLDIFWAGRHRQALCSYFVPDGGCNTIIDFLDFTSIYLAKHLMWERTLRLTDRLCGKIFNTPLPGAVILDKTEPKLGPEYSVHAAPTQKRFVHGSLRRLGWEGVWPGSAAPHDYASNLQLADDTQCHCGSGKRYDNCHRILDAEGLELVG